MWNVSGSHPKHQASLTWQVTILGRFKMMQIACASRWDRHLAGSPPSLQEGGGSPPHDVQPATFEPPLAQTGKNVAFRIDE